MKKLLILLSLIALPAYAQFPVHYNATTSDISKISGNWDSFNWKWAGGDSQSNYFILKNGSAFIDTTGYNIGMKLSRYTETGMLTYISTTNASIQSGSNVTFIVANTNIPSNGQCLMELWMWQGTGTNLSRTVAQGKVTIYNSLYADEDTLYPWPEALDFLTETNAYQLFWAKSTPVLTQLVMTASGSVAQTGSVAYINVDLSGLSTTQQQHTAGISSASNAAVQAQATADSVSNSLSGKASLTGNNTYTGTNSFEGNGAASLRFLNGFTVGSGSVEFTVPEISMLLLDGGFLRVASNAVAGTDVVNLDTALLLMTTNNPQSFLTPTTGSNLYYSAGSTVVAATSSTYAITADVSSNLTLEANGNLNGFSLTNGSGITVTGTVAAEQLTSTDDAYITDRLGIGTNTPAYQLHVQDGGASVTAWVNADNIVIEGGATNYVGMSILGADLFPSVLVFGSVSDFVGARLEWNYTLGLFNLAASKAGADLALGAGNNTEMVRIKSDGKVGIGTNAPATTLDVNGTTTLRGNVNLAGVADITNGLRKGTFAFCLTSNAFYQTPTLDYPVSVTNLTLWDENLIGCVADWYTCGETNPLSRTLFYTGMVYSAGQVGMSNVAVNVSIPIGRMVGCIITNGACTNASARAKYTY